MQVRQQDQVLLAGEQVVPPVSAPINVDRI
jgi:hypothetical protein